MAIALATPCFHLILLLIFKTCDLGTVLLFTLIIAFVRCLTITIVIVFVAVRDLFSLLWI